MELTTVNIPDAVGAGSPAGTITYSHDSLPFCVSQSKSAVVPLMLDMVSPVGAKQLGGGAQVTKISYPEALITPSLSKTNVSAPVASVEVIGSGAVDPVNSPTSVLEVSGPL